MTVAYHQSTLDNGLTIIAETSDEAHTAAIGFFVKTGARDEPPALMGVSHFLEHMMFKGTKQRTAEDVDRDFDDIGANHNAYTTAEQTAFWAHCLPEHLPRATEILADIMRPSIRPDDFDDEKKVILEEIAMYQDVPFWVLYERATEEYYGSHPLSHRVLGTPETVGGMLRDQMLDYFTTRYSSDNTVVTLAGRLDFEAMVDRIREWCGRWNRTDTERRYPDVPEIEKQFTIELETVNRHYLLMLCPAPAMTDDRRYAAAMLAQVLGDAEGSRLYWALVETGLAEEAQAQYDGRDGVGDCIIYVSCSPENAERVEKIALDEAASLLDSVTDDDLERVRNKVATAATMHGELPGGRMRRLGQVWTYTGEYRSLEDELERINAVTLDELRAVHEAFPIRPRIIGRLSPKRG
jgi:predicted Zn-dependent peptidase